MSKKIIATLGETLKKLRLERKLPQRKVAALLDIDTSILSKFEKDIRQPSDEVIEKIALIFNISSDTLKFEAVTDKVAFKLIEDDIDTKTLRVAEDKVEYLKSKKKSSK